jgi:hypothetical protein
VAGFTFELLVVVVVVYVVLEVKSVPISGEFVAFVDIKDREGRKILFMSVHKFVINKHFFE